MLNKILKYKFMGGINIKHMYKNIKILFISYQMDDFPPNSINKTGNPTPLSEKIDQRPVACILFVYE